MKKKEMPIRFAFYGRVSSDQQDIENSIAGQRSVAKDYAVSAGGFIVKEYIDEAKSGRVADRPGFQEMIKDGISPDPTFDAIIVWKLNRFARNVKDMIRYWDLLEEHGIKVISVMEPMLVGATGRLMRNVIASFDEFFSENMASDIKRGMKQAVERGYWIGYPAPLGYQAVKVLDGSEDEENDNKQKTRRKLDLDPPRDKLARHIWELALKDLSVLDIARKVTDEGYLTKAGKKFTKNKIHRILTNQAYTGFVVWNVDPKTGVPEARSKKQAHPDIVSKAEFDKVQQKLKSRAPNVQHPRTAANEHLFNDLGKCSLCGGKILIKSGKNGTYFYFTCKTRDDFGEKACDLPSYSIAKNDPIIMRAIIDHILAKENLRDLITIVRASAGPTMQDQERQIANIDLQIKSLNEREDRLIDAIEEGKNPRKKLDARIDKIEADIKEQEAKRAEVISLMGDEATILQDPDLIVAYAEDVRTYLQREHVKSVNAICRRFIKTIRFEPGFAEIEYTIPIPDGTTKPEAKKHKVALQTRVPRTVPDGPPLPAAAYQPLRHLISVCWRYPWPAQFCSSYTSPPDRSRCWPPWSRWSRRRDRRYHILAGRVYAIAMTVIFLTSLPLAILGASAFLLLIAVFSFHLVFAGWRFARNRRGAPQSVDWCAAAIMGLTGLTMWGYGIALGRAGNGQWVTMLIFGGIAVALSLVDARYYARSAKRRTRAGVPRSSDTLPICWPEPSPLLPRWQW